MRETAFTNVLQSAKSGDILVLESGYNDRSNSTVEAMQEAITAMVNEASALGVKVFVVTPNASAHDYNANVSWSAYVRIAVSVLDNATLIDLATESYNFLSNKYWTLSADDRTTLLTSIYNNSGDTLHSTYNAANCWAVVVARGIYYSGYEKYINTSYEYTFNDSIEDVTVKVLEATAEPTLEPTETPTSAPTATPTVTPTSAPITEGEPTTEPTETIAPTTAPTTDPTAEETVAPTTEPTIEPTAEPTTDPTAAPTTEPIADEIKLSYDNGYVTISGEMINSEAILIQAIYKSDGTLEKVIVYDNVTANEPIEVSADFEKTKFMLWDSLKNMKPLVDVIKE
jgi:hypothetical protein